MKLTPRLQAIADKVPPGSRVADIGTDHAYIPVYLLMNHLSSNVIASDNRQGPLLAAEETLRLFGLIQAAELRLGDGLSVLTEEDQVGTAVIAGIGGETICAILQEGLELVKKGVLLVLQPMTGTALVRKWLAEKGFAILQEDIAEEEEDYYEVIVARWTGESWAGEEKILAIGPRLIAEKHSLLGPMLQQRIGRLVEAAAAARKSVSATAQERAEELEEQISWLNEVLSWL